MIKISFLIPAYNQLSDVKACISSVVKYPEDDIEIVVSDDNSPEDLSGVIKNFNDDRIKWIKNKENLGLDGNILYGVSRCDGEFVFLLRTRDYIISDAIYDVVRIIDNYPSVACISGSCLDDDGLPRLLFEKRIYRQGDEAIEAHYKLPFHPSGVAFRRSLIDTKLIKKYMGKYDNTLAWFMADQLIRLKLSTIGDFFLLDEPIWIYTYTNRSKSRSVHKGTNGNPYAPEYTRNRYCNEMDFICNEIDTKYKAKLIMKCFSFWLFQATISYKANTEDPELQRHYGNKAQRVDIRKERAAFLEYSKSRFGGLYSDLGIENQVKLCIRENVEKERKRGIEKKRHEEMINSLKFLSNRLVDDNKCLSSFLEQRGVKSVGIYGAGYLGREVWNNLKNNKKIKVKYVCDKKYPQKISIEKDTYALPPKEIGTVNVDICLITPIQYYEEIVNDLPVSIRSLSIEECFSAEE